MANRWMWIAWPAFMAACVLELLVFAVIDPSELAWSGHALGWPRQAVYTAAFFLFWVVTAGACGITVLLRKTSAEINACPYPPRQRPYGCPGK